MMMTAPNTVAVVATQLPGTDRRALSQAWYSALHLAEKSTPHIPARPLAGPASSAHVPTSAHTISSIHRSELRVNAVAGERGARTAVPSGASERRAPRTELAQRIERALVPRPRAPMVASASLAIKARDGRVHLLVRTDGSTTRIVALCAPALRERVESALAQARFALAAAGAHVTVDAR